MVHNSYYCGHCNGGRDLPLGPRESKTPLALATPRGPLKVLNPEEKVPPLVGMDLNGKELKVEYPSSQRTVLLWFSAACPSCESNMEFWKEIYQKHRAEKLRFIGVTSAGEEKTKEFILEISIRISDLDHISPFAFGKVSSGGNTPDNAYRHQRSSPKSMARTSFEKFTKKRLRKSLPHLLKLHKEWRINKTIRRIKVEG